MIDIAGRHAGIIMGISNTISTLSGILSPYIVGRITIQQTQRDWQIVFWISFAIEIAGATFYTIFLSDQTQDWAKNVTKKQSNDRQSIANSELDVTISEVVTNN